MKSKVFAAALVACGLLAGRSAAQEKPKVYYGIRTGLNFCSFTAGTDATDNDVKLGFAIGPYLRFPLNDWISLQPEFLFSSKGGVYRSRRLPTPMDSQDVSYLYRVNLNYIDVPLLTTLRIAKIMHLQAGPQVSYLATANFRERPDKLDLAPYKRIGGAERFNRLDVALMVGTAVELGPLNFTVRYAYGFIPIAPEGRMFEGVRLMGDKKHNSVMQLSAGFEF